RRLARRSPRRAPRLSGADRLVTQVRALGRHLALVGFMGARKSTLGEKAARLSGRPFVDLDREIECRHAPVAELFERGEPEFRRLEEEVAAEVLSLSAPAVIALGGGAVLSERTRDLLRSRAYTVRVEVDPAAAWERVRRSDRPLARDEEAFRALSDERLPLYDQVSATSVRSVDDVLLAALEIEVARGRLAGLDAVGSGAVTAVAQLLAP